MTHWRLRQLPASARLVLTCYLAITAGGYLLGVANIYFRHRAADGASGLSLDDVKAVYGGLEVEVKQGQALPSRMLEMVDTQMREFLRTEADYAALRAWLAAGAPPESFQTPSPGAAKSPQDILADSCVRCHMPDGEKGQEEAHMAPFAADLFSPVEYQLVSKYTATPVDSKTGIATVGPQSMERLVLVGHIHMLTIPAFVLVTSLLAAFTGIRPWLRSVVVTVPMLSLVLDFAGWWLARKWAWTFWLIVGSGPVFGLFFGLQILIVFCSMWFGKRAPGEGYTAPGY